MDKIFTDFGPNINNPVMLRAMLLPRIVARHLESDIVSRVLRFYEFFKVRTCLGRSLLRSICAYPVHENRIIPVFWPRVSTEASL